MTQSSTMKLTRYLICTVLMVVCAQSTESSDPVKHLLNQNLNCNNALAKADLRGLRDVWSKIRESAIATWNYIKSVGDYTRQKINIFVESAKQYARDLKRQFDGKIQELKDRVQKIISDIYGTGDLVKQCMKKEQDHMGDIFKKLMANMGQCIGEEIKQLSSIPNDQSEPAMNQTIFIQYLETKKDHCENNVENIQECLSNIRRDIFDNFTGIENELLQKNFKARSIADDIKETLVTCSISNLIDASNLVSTEVVEIAQCVMEAKKNEDRLHENDLIS